MRRLLTVFLLGGTQGGVSVFDLCDGATNIADVVKLANVAIRGVDPDVESCEPCL